MEVVRHYADITPQHIQDWKAKRGAHVLREITVPVDEDTNTEAKFILAIPDQKTFIAISEQKEETKVNQMLIANTVLGGDMEHLENNAQVYAAVLVECATLLKNKPAQVKKI